VSQHNILTWSTDARYHLDDNTMFYGRVATGWRPGGPNDLPPGAPPAVNRSFAPDSLTDYEVGVKSVLPNENLSFDADVYSIEWRDIQLLELVQNFNINGNGGRANSKGAEANVTWQPIDRLTLNLNGAYTFAVLSEDAPAVGGFAGNSLPNSPRASGTLNGDYEFLPLDDFTPYVGASLHYIGVRGSGFAISSATNSPIPEINLPDYVTVDIRAGISWSKWSIELYGKNINDAKGISTFGAFGGSAASIVAPNPLPAATASLIEPRIFGIILRGKF
jgi:outer membrane receptor protein involved in Fe transport